MAFSFAPSTIRLLTRSCWGQICRGVKFWNRWKSQPFLSCTAKGYFNVGRMFNSIVSCLENFENINVVELLVFWTTVLLIFSSNIFFARCYITVYILKSCTYCLVVAQSCRLVSVHTMLCPRIQPLVENSGKIAMSPKSQQAIDCFNVFLKNGIRCMHAYTFYVYPYTDSAQ